MIPPEFIDEVLDRTDIVEIIEARVPLKKSGQNYSGLCPFHNEKTPSFTVSGAKQFYYCFGCQASGHALKFLMEFDRMDFVSAVEYLAGRVGLSVPENRRVDGRVSERRKSLYKVLEESTAFYREMLRTHQTRDRAVSYLKARGVSGEIARDFALGYAPPGWDNLMQALAVTNTDRQLLIDAGMLTEHADDNKTYDRFRDRIVFPIRDQRGRTIAFGGRVLDDTAGPKYLNSPETPVFHKGRELYGLFEAGRRVRNPERLIVVEGYMDVVALAQHGIGYSVATLGTATSTAHIERLFRMAPEVVFCFDGDEAGRNAAGKALEAALPAMQDGCTVRFLFIPDGEDPDSLIRREGRGQFERRIDSARPLADFFFQILESGLDMASLEGRAKLSKQALPLLGRLPEGMFRQLLLKELSERTGLEADRLAAAAADSPPAERHAGLARAASAQRRLKQSTLGEYAMTLLLRQPEVANELDEQYLARLDGVPEWQLLMEIVHRVRQGNASPMLLLSHYQEGPWFEYLKNLAERDPMLPRELLAGEFLNTLQRMFREADNQQKQRVIEDLSCKRPSELTAPERELLTGYRRGAE